MKCGSFAKRKEKNSRRKISVARKTLVCYAWISQSLTSQNKGSTINLSFCYSHSVSSLFSIAPFHNISPAFRTWLKLALFSYLTSFFFFFLKIPAVEFFRKTSFSLEQFSLRFCTSLAFYLPLFLRQLLFYFYPSFLLNSSLLLLLRTFSSSFVPTNRSFSPYFPSFALCCAMSDATVSECLPSHICESAFDHAITVAFMRKCDFTMYNDWKNTLVPFCMQLPTS